VTRSAVQVLLCHRFVLGHLTQTKGGSAPHDARPIPKIGIQLGLLAQRCQSKPRQQRQLGRFVIAACGNSTSMLGQFCTVVHIVTSGAK
jgi:hypothetical protein